MSKSHAEEISQKSTATWQVIKIGGSLLDVPELSARIQHLADFFSAPVLLIPGGGEFANEIRRLDRIHNWPTQLSHEMAIRTMSLTALLLAKMSCDWPVVTSSRELAATVEHNRISILDVAELSGLKELPASWSLTSDSIAAWAALEFGNRRLVLAKSVDLPHPLPTLKAAAERQLVDDYFPLIGDRLAKLQWINLRSPSLELNDWG